MASVLAQMSALIFCGMLWRHLRPWGSDANRIRRFITALVFNVLLPALVLAALWGKGARSEGWKISLFGAAIVLFGIAATLLLSRTLHMSRRKLGAAMLGISFSNVTFLGLPVLEQTLGPDTARPIVIQIDMFATAPLVFTLGIYIASRYGDSPGSVFAAFRALLVNPPLWAALAALALDELAVPLPLSLKTALETAAVPVAPLMLVALGLSLSWKGPPTRNLRLLALASTLKLLAMPLFGLGLAHMLSIVGDTRTALVLEAGMPSMLLGVVYCDRYRLDAELYAMLATLSTLLALGSLPLWHLTLSTWLRSSV